LFLNIRHGGDKMDVGIKNHIKIIGSLFIVFVILLTIHYTVGHTIVSQCGYNVCTPGESNIVFHQDDINKTLTVTNLYTKCGGWYWSDFTIINGSATLPSGKVKIGDVITNCEGYLEIGWGTPIRPIWVVDFR
jgi:hypothetical protein